MTDRSTDITGGTNDSRLAPERGSGAGSGTSASADFAGHDGWEDLMIEVLDGRAGERERVLERHLLECGGCTAVFAQYRRLFAALAEAGAALAEAGAAESSQALVTADSGVAEAGAVPDGDCSAPSPVDRRPSEFWDELNRDIERRIASDVEARPWPGVVDLRERTTFARQRTLAGGLIAAGIAILVLVGVYLELPRTGSDPQAFTSAAGASELGSEVSEGRRAAVLPEAAWTELDPAILLALTTLSGDASGAEGGVVESVNPISALADPEEALDGLTREEADELLQSLEAQT